MRTVARHAMRWLGVLVLAGTLAAPAAQAALFSDDEARRAILDLRQKLEQTSEAQRRQQAELSAQMAEQTSQLRKALLELNAQLETLRAENARLRGQGEQLGREVAELQRRLNDVQQGIDARISRIEPQKVTFEGREFSVEPEEKRLYEEAVATFRRGDFAAAAASLAAFVSRYPASGYRDAAQFWLGNAYYGKRDYKEAIDAFRTLVARAPGSPHAPEALLSIANCQVELKDGKAARRTIDELIKAYPQSEAAEAGRQRLASLR